MVRKNFLHKLVCEVAMRVFCQIVLQTTLSFREKVLTHSKVKYDLIALERERERATLTEKTTVMKCTSHLCVGTVR